MRAHAVEAGHLEEDPVGPLAPRRLARRHPVRTQGLGREMFGAQEVGPPSPRRGLDRRRELHQHVAIGPVRIPPAGGELRLLATRRGSDDRAGEHRCGEALVSSAPCGREHDIGIAQHGTLHLADGGISDDEVPW
jgi:hypothetical protein